VIHPGGSALAAVALVVGVLAVAESPADAVMANPAGPAVADPAAIAAAPDGAVWFIESGGVARMTSAGGLTKFSIGHGLGDIAADPAGDVWFTEPDAHRIGRITPAGEVTRFRTGIGPKDHPARITSGPDGDLWFTGLAGNRIGRITTSGAVTAYSGGTTSDSAPADITAAPDGNLWFTESNGRRIGRITPTGALTEFPAPVSSSGRITAGPSGPVWFTAENDRIARITPRGAVKTFPTGIHTLPGRTEIAAGPDGRVWFTDPSGSRIGRMSRTGSVRFFHAPFGAQGDYFSRGGQMAAGADGNVWFTEPARGRIARISPAGVVAHVPPTPVMGAARLRPRGTVAVALHCSAAADLECHGVVWLDAIGRYGRDLVRVSAGSFRLAPAMRAKLRLRLSPGARRRLAADGLLRLRVGAGPWVTPPAWRPSRTGGVERIVVLRRPGAGVRLHTGAEALRLVRAIFEPYRNADPEHGPSTLGDCFISPDQPCAVGPVDGYVAPALRDRLQRLAEEGTGMDPVVCAQNTPGRIAYGAPRVAGDTATIVVSTFWGAPSVDRLTMRVSLESLIVTGSSCGRTAPAVAG
jgi:streptogramin lyase